MRILLVLTFLVFGNIQCNQKIDKSKKNVVSLSEKQRGIHLFRISDSINYQTFVDQNIEWITLVPWGFQDSHDSPFMEHSRGDSLQIKETYDYWFSRVENAHNAGLKVFIKPHVWIHNSRGGKWRSDIYPTNESDWMKWKKSYRAFILHYAELAQKSHAEMFCVGVEFTRLSLEKPMFWEELIVEIRKIYSGKITYAANWYKEYEELTFWDQLDFIGIQAYFPLTKIINPSKEELQNGWKPHVKKIENIHKQYNRPILFTEMGYKSTVSSAIRPWEWAEHESKMDNTYSPETQAACYEAFFDEVWEKDWFSGVHLWQYRGNFVNDSTRQNVDFTPQGKVAEKVILKGFSKNK